MKLNIGQSDRGRFSLPIDAVTQTIAILAKRGVGKTYTASVLGEELLEARQQVIVLDPTGAWSGLRSSADGKAAGYPIVVAGGEHADIPITEHSGEILARSAVSQRFSLIVDLSAFRKGESVRFVTQFLETLYRLNREPVHLFVDEADDIAPQKPWGNEAQMLGAIEDVVKRGRRKGIGCTLITQRPADLAKQVLTQCEMLVALRMSHPRDINAIKEWVNVHADPAQAKAMIESLPSLPTGTAWFWSPGWGDIFEQVKVRQRRTFDSSATPKAGEKARVPKVLAKVDIERLGAEIQATVEQAKANDPKALKARIAELERQVKAAPTAKPPVDDAAIKRAVATAVAPIRKAASTALAKLKHARESVSCVEVILADAIGALVEVNNANAAKVSPPKLVGYTVQTTQTASDKVIRSVVSRGPGDGSLGRGVKYKMLVALCQFPDGLSSSRLAALAGASESGGGFGARLSELRVAGYIAGDRARLTATDAGIAAVGDFDPLPTGDALIDYWRGRIGGGVKRGIFDALVAAYPNSLSRESLAEAAGASADGGGFGARLSELRTMGLVTGGKEIKAADELFQ